MTLNWIKLETISGLLKGLPNWAGDEYLVFIRTEMLKKYFIFMYQNGVLKKEKFLIFLSKIHVQGIRSINIFHQNNLLPQIAKSSQARRQGRQELNTKY